jgi:hypoxanthine phosphoribosyltransferase
VNRADVPAHQPALDLFRATTALTGSTVLIVDDTWTTGAHAQSASAALKAAGASGTAILTLGRWITPDYADHGDWLVRQRRHQQWSWSSCAVGAH